jgi:hypothetical protein
MSMKNSNDTIGNRSRDLPVCSAVPQPTAPPRAPVFLWWIIILFFFNYFNNYFINVEAVVNKNSNL